jgi:hypothetical protein
VKAGLQLGAYSLMFSTWTVKTMDARLGTLAEQILHTLRVSARAWDDDELAARLGVSHRQAVNQVCNRLVLAGRLRRYQGAAGKLVNESLDPIDEGRPVADEPHIELVAEIQPAPGHSGEQRAAESLILAHVERVLGVTLKPRRIVTATGARVEVDGADDELTVLVEAWAHQGPPKSAQKHKVLADALKLTWIASTLPVRPRLILCLSDDAAARPFREGRSWAAEALRDLEIEILVAELSPDVRNTILAAQLRQHR